MGLAKLYNLTWWTHQDRPVLKVMGRNEKGEKVVAIEEYPFKPYFFVRKSDVRDDLVVKVKEIDPFAEFVDTDAVNTSWEPLTKVEMSNADRVLDAAKAFVDNGGNASFEADVPFARRVMVDQGRSVDIPEKKLFFDIEVDSTGGFPDVEKASSRILSIAACDKSDRFWSFCDDDETAMIRAFLDLCNSYDVVAGWASAGFDWPYLRQRCRNLNIRFDWFSLVHVDLLPLYRLLSLRNKPQDYKLGTVSKFELGKEKLDVNVTKLRELFEKDRSQLEIYNIEDAKLAMEIDQKFKIVEILFSIAAVSHVPVQGLINTSKLTSGLNHSVAVDGLLLYLAGRRNPRIVFDTRGQKTNEDGTPLVEGYQGGFVFEPQTGLHDNVMNLDFSSLYPSLIKTFNIGLETFREDGTQEIDAVFGGFMRKPKSVLAEAVEYMGRRRAEYKSKKAALDQSTQEYQVLAAQEYAIKTLLLSFYGVIGRVGTRYYKKEIAENVTMLGQAFIKKARGFAEREGYDVVMGDTDSIFVKLKPGVVKDDLPKALQELADVINAELTVWSKEEFDIEESFLEMNVERIFSTLFIQAKKKYAGIVVWQGQPTLYMHIAGMEVKRKDWPAAVGEFQQELLKMILSKASQDDVAAFVTSTKAELFAGKLDDGLGVYKSLSRDVSDYKTDVQHVRVSKMITGTGPEMKKGDKVAFIKAGPRKEDIIPLDGITKPKITMEGYKYIWSNQFEPIMERVQVSMIRKLDDFLGVE